MSNDTVNLLVYGLLSFISKKEVGTQWMVVEYIMNHSTHRVGCHL